MHAVARQLVEDGHVDQATYDAARQLLGDRGVVELVTLCGYYTLVSFTLNAFDVALPPGEAPAWPPSPLNPSSWGGCRTRPHAREVRISPTVGRGRLVRGPGARPARPGRQSVTSWCDG